MAGYDIFEYVEGLVGQTFPPLLLEVQLKSGKSYFIKNAFRPDQDRELLGLRVWDLRATDVNSLPAKVNAVQDREEWERFSDIDDTLDQANLWVRVTEIEAIMEWHERYWSVAQPEDAPPTVGFFQPEEEENGPSLDE